MHGQKVSPFGLHRPRKVFVVRGLKEWEVAQARWQFVRRVVVTDADSPLEAYLEGACDLQVSLAVNRYTLRNKLVDKLTGCFEHGGGRCRVCLRILENGGCRRVFLTGKGL
jgi:hypothetical protein